MYEIYLLCVGTAEADASRMLALTDHGKLITIPFVFYCLKGPDGPILVDTGFRELDYQARNRVVRGFRAPESLLAALGVDPASVPLVIMTHLHWDHFDAHSLYPRATFAIQRGEIEFVAGPLMRFLFLRQFVTDGAAEAIEGLRKAGRLHVLEPGEEIRPGIRCIPLGGHTPHIQVVTVRTARGTAVLANDTVDRYRNIEENIPPGISYNNAEALAAYETIRRLASAPDLIIPGHDDGVLTRFPAVAPGVHRLA
jgi:glyoxylase-like metal-dependent hydrolase (beta-lactamase superfamily II)